jgi:hypothetical protein
MVFAQWARIVSALPDVSRACLPGVEIRGIPAVGVTQSGPKRSVPFGHHDQVHVIRHQAIPQNRQPLQFRVLLQQAEIHQPVVVGLKHYATPVAALRDVVRRLQRFYSR